MWQGVCTTKAARLHDTMKDYIASLLRHAFTALAGLGGFLLSKGLIDAADAPAVDGAGGTLGAALAVILTAILGRLVLSLTAKVFRSGAGESGNRGGSGDLPLVLILGTGAAFMGLCLPSCSPGLPIKATVQVEEGALSYSSKGGLEMEYRPGYGRMPEVYRDK